MPEERRFFTRRRIIITSIILLVLILSVFYFFYVSTSGKFHYSDSDTFFSEFGDFLGIIGLTALILVYSRTLLKITVQKGTLSKRLQPLESENFKIESFMKKTLRISNTLHPYLGIVAVVAIFLHCYFTSSFMDNLLLQGALLLLAWQGFFGLILKFRFTPAFLRRRSYLVHAQFFTGILLLILAGLGHLLLGG
jgi:hypothetical protein